MVGTPCLHGKGRKIRETGEEEKDLDVRGGFVSRLGKRETRSFFVVQLDYGGKKMIK